MTVQTYLGRFARTHAWNWPRSMTPTNVRPSMCVGCWLMPDLQRMLTMAQWEVRFRGFAFALIGLVLLYDWVGGWGVRGDWGLGSASAVLPDPPYPIPDLYSRTPAPRGRLWR